MKGSAKKLEFSAESGQMPVYKEANLTSFSGILSCKCTYTYQTMIV